MPRYGNDNPYDTGYGVIGSLRNLQDTISSIGNDYLRRKQEERALQRERAAINLEQTRTEGNLALDLERAKQARLAAQGDIAYKTDVLAQNKWEALLRADEAEKARAAQVLMHRETLAANKPKMIRPIDLFMETISNKQAPASVRNSMRFIIDQFGRSETGYEAAVMNTPMPQETAYKVFMEELQNNKQYNETKALETLSSRVNNRYADTIKVLEDKNNNIPLNSPLAKSFLTDVLTNPALKVNVIEYQTSQFGDIPGTAKPLTPEEIIDRMNGQVPQGKTGGKLTGFGPQGQLAPAGTTTLQPGQSIAYKYTVTPNYDVIKNSQRDTVDSWVRSQRDMSKSNVMNQVAGKLQNISRLNASPFDIEAVTRNITDNIIRANVTNLDDVDLDDINKLNEFMKDPRNIDKYVNDYLSGNF